MWEEFGGKTRKFMEDLEYDLLGVRFCSASSGLEKTQVVTILTRAISNICEDSTYTPV